MNISRRTLLWQITLKSDVAQSVYQMQRLKIHNSQYGINSLFNLAKPIAPKPINFVENQIIRGYAEQSWMKKQFINVFGRYKTHAGVLEGKSVLLYGQAVDSLNISNFVSKFRMPNTFNSWFLVVEIHVWMLMVRAMAEKEHGQTIRNGLVTALWTDTLTRGKEMAPGSFRLIKKQIGTLSEQFQYAIISYDEGLSDDKLMASALWKRFFESNCDDYEHIELLIKYIRCNTAKLDNLGIEDFLTKRTITWTTLEDLDHF